MRHENKFKIGDRVLRGKEYDVLGVNDPYIDVLEDGKPRGMYARRFELTPALTIEPGKHYRTRNGKVTGRVSKGDTGFEAVVDGKVRIYDAAGGHVHGDADLDIVEAWVPKVGERVRFVRDNTDSGAEYWAKGEVVAVMRESDGKRVDVSSSRFDWHPNAHVVDLEPLPVAPQQAAKVGAQVDTLAEEYGPVAPERKLLKTGQGYGYELARFVGYVWVDIGKTAPITIRANKIAA